MRYIFFMTLVLMFTSCKKEDKPIEYTRDKYFQSFSQFVENNDFNAISYIFEDSKPVANFDSTELTEGYRFFWLRTFHNPVLITIVAEGEGGQLNIRVTDGEGGYDPGRLIRNENISLKKDQMEILRKVIHNNPFWEDAPANQLGLDGAEWYIEVKQLNKHYKGRQWSPDEGKIRTVGLYMLELSGLEIKKNEIY
jgi:hypothetical protein